MTAQLRLLHTRPHQRLQHHLQTHQRHKLKRDGPAHHGRGKTILAITFMMTQSRSETPASPVSVQVRHQQRRQQFLYRLLVVQLSPR